MKQTDFLPYINHSVQITRTNKKGYSVQQTGRIKALTDLNMILDIGDGEEKIIEISKIESCTAIT